VPGHPSRAWSGAANGDSGGRLACVARTERSGWERVAHARPVRVARRLAGRVEVVQVERFGGSLVSVLFRTPVLVLHTTGRRTGTLRSTPLAFETAAQPRRAFLVVGGAGGQARVPDWVANLRAHGRAAITVDRERLEVRAVELAGDERDATWAVLRRRWPRIDTYERRAGRSVPVFRFEVVDDHPPSGRR
jgi:deazaflavin-dependent oxidoreductase (nitroreductase family)